MGYDTLIDIERRQIREYLKWEREKVGDTREVTEEDMNEFIQKCMKYYLKDLENDV